MSNKGCLIILFLLVCGFIALLIFAPVAFIVVFCLSLAFFGLGYEESKKYDCDFEDEDEDENTNKN